MNRGTGVALGAALAFVSGIALAACAEESADEADTTPAAEAQTTQATLPVVTVYKAPT